MNKYVNIICLLLYSYVIISHIFVFYFLYLWSQTHSFINTITIGIIISEIKGILFPFFI